MFLKDRKEPMDLRKMRILRPRMSWSDKDDIYYWTLQKGFEGELQFDRLMEQNLSRKKLIVNDLLLQHNQTYFQIDTLMFLQNSLYLFDIKNFEGDFYIEEDRWYSAEGKKIKNPLHQLERCNVLLQGLLRDMGFKNIPIKPYLIFINPQFSLYQAPLNHPFVFPTQLRRLMFQMNNLASIPTEKNMKLLNRLLDLHIHNSPFTNVPAYTFEQLEKRISCMKCNHFIVPFNEKMVICQHCGNVESLQSAVLRSVEEFKILFPDLKVTTNILFEWTGGIWPKKRLHQILYENYMNKGYGRFSYYE